MTKKWNAIDASREWMKKMKQENKEFNLSEYELRFEGHQYGWYSDMRVKEFIRLLKKELVNDDDEITCILHEIIDKLAGDKLI